MSIFLKDLVQIDDTVEYAVLKFKKEKTDKFNYTKIDTVQEYIAKVTNSIIKYKNHDYYTSENNRSLIEIKIVKNKPKQGNEKYEDEYYDYYTLPIIKISLNMGLYRSIKNVIKWHTFMKVENINIIDLLNKYYPDKKGVCCLRRYIKNPRVSHIRDLLDKDHSIYIVSESEPVTYLNPNSHSAMEFAGKINAFNMIWRELINRKIKAFEFTIPENEITPNTSNGIANISIKEDYFDDKLTDIICTIKIEIKDIIKKKLEERFSDFFTILDECKIDKNPILSDLVNSCCGKDRIYSHKTTINLEELMK